MGASPKPSIHMYQGVTSLTHMSLRAHSGPSCQHSVCKAPCVCPTPHPPQTCSCVLTACLVQERATGVKIPDFLGLLITFQVSIAVEDSQPVLNGIKQPPFNSSMGQEFRQDTVWVQTAFHPPPLALWALLELVKCVPVHMSVPPPGQHGPEDP